MFGIEKYLWLSEYKFLKEIHQIQKWKHNQYIAAGLKLLDPGDVRLYAPE
jgi:hypothetical protein